MNFKDNPFWILDASPRDSKRVLHDKAENKSFELPEDICRNAENILLTPKKRLEAELSWFPGISPKKTKELLEQVESDAKNNIYDSAFFEDFDDLVCANAFALFLSNASAENLDKDCCRRIIEDFCVATSYLDEQKILASINEDRVASGFAEVSRDVLEQELPAVHYWYKQVLHSFMDQLDSNVLIDILTVLIDDVTDKGNDKCDWDLLDNIISDYEVDVTPFFEKQEEQITCDINKIVVFVEKKLSAVNLSALVEKLEKDVRHWDKVAQPIQVLYKSKGIEHKRSSALAKKIRELAIALYNKYERCELSERIAKLLLDVFAEVPRIAEAVSEDLEFLTTSAQDYKKWKRIEDILSNYNNMTKFPSITKENFIRCIKEVMPIIEELRDMEAGKNYLAAFCLQYIIKYANREKDYAACIKMLDYIKPWITDKELLLNFEKNAIVIKQNLSLKNAQAKDRRTYATIYAISIFVFGVIGAIAGGVDGFLGGLVLGAVFWGPALFQCLSERR